MNAPRISHASLAALALLGLATGGCGAGSGGDDGPDGAAECADGGGVDDASTLDAHRDTALAGALDGDAQHADVAAPHDTGFAADGGAHGDGSDDVDETLPAPARFATLPPHASLPTGAQCAAWVKGTAPKERRPENVAANHLVPPAADLGTFHTHAVWGDFITAADFTTVDGDFTGTTEEIFRWVACKWGVDEDVVRAQAWQESGWKQGNLHYSAADHAGWGDFRSDPALCKTAAWDGWQSDLDGCYQSCGILQTKVFDFNTYPASCESTAFNADFRMAYQRGCMNGDVHYLHDRDASYPGTETDTMLWGCVGHWFSGGWNDSGALDYIAGVRDHLVKRPWTSL
ncbi:MAG: hypothetical protein NVSMB47_11620 [Polyangiales bacterium]